MSGIDWDQLDAMQETAFNTLAELQETADSRVSLPEDEARALSFRAQIALNILNIQPPRSGSMEDLFPFMKAPPEAEGPAAEEEAT